MSFTTSVTLFIDLADDSLVLVAEMDETMQELREVQRELANLTKRLTQVGGKYEKQQREIRRHRAKLCEYGAMEDEVKEVINEVYMRFFQVVDRDTMPKEHSNKPQRHTAAHRAATDAALEAYYRRQEEEQPVASSSTQPVGRAGSPLDHEHLRHAFPGNSASDPITLK